MLTYSSNQSLLIVGDQIGQLHQIDIRSYQAPVNSFKGHEGAVTSLNSYSTHGKILSASLDGTIKVWDMATFTTESPEFITLSPNTSNHQSHGITGLEVAGNEIYSSHDSGFIYRSKFPQK